MGVLGSVRTSLDRAANLRSRLLKEAEKGAREVEKWRELGKVDSENRKMLELGTLYLERYDHGAFGLREVVYNRPGATPVFLQALDDVIGRMGRWVEERRKARGLAQRGG